MMIYLYLKLHRHTVTLVLLTLLLIGCVNKAAIPVINKSPHRIIPVESVVKNGDSIYTISWQHGLNYLDIAKWNGLKKPYAIRAGQRLSLRNRTQATAATTALASAPDVASQPLKPKPPAVKTSTATTITPSASSAVALTTPKQWQWPAKGKVLQKFSRDNGINGIRIGNVPGSPVVATAGGEVVYVGNSLPGYGNLIIIKHTEAFLSAYAHNRKILVKEGQGINAGGKVAEMGSSGTDKTMLHFEIRLDGKPQDPLKYLGLKS